MSTLRIQLGSNLWARYSTSTPARLVVHGGAHLRASSLAELYLLLAHWSSTRSIVVVQDDIDLSAFRGLDSTSVSWEGQGATAPGAWSIVPGPRIASDDTLLPLHTWLDGLGQPQQVRLAVEKVIVEAVGNAHEHSQSRVSPMLFVTPTGKDIEFAVVDAGRGVRASLAENPKYRDLSSDVKAMTLALQDGVSRHTIVGRGGGLKSICRIIARLNGTVTFRSGAGEVAFDATPEETRQIEARVELPAPGVQVLARILRRST